MLDGCTNITYADSHAKAFDIKEMVELMRSFKVEDDLRKSRSYFDMMQMEPCAVCGQRVEYREQPYEHIVMCRHVADHIPTAPAPKMAFDVPAMFRLDAMPVVFREEKL